MNTEHVCTCESLSWVGFIDDPCKVKEERTLESFFYTTVEDTTKEDLPKTGEYNITTYAVVFAVILCLIGTALYVKKRI